MASGSISCKTSGLIRVSLGRVETIGPNLACGYVLCVWPLGEALQRDSFSLLPPLVFPTAGTHVFILLGWEFL